MSDDRATDDGRCGSEAGLSLVEMLVALTLLGVILSAVGAVLVTTTRTILQNERRVQATALASEAHESFQAGEFDLIGLYEDEALDLVAAGIVQSNAGDLEYDGRDVVTLAKPDTAGAPEYCRLPLDSDCARESIVPLAREWPNPVVEGQEYELYRVVTWIDRSGDGIEDTKRLTTVVRWNVLGRTHEELLDSERVATIEEAGDFDDVRIFVDLTRRVRLDEFTNRTEQVIRVYARFTEGMQTAEVEYSTLDFVADADGNLTVPVLVPQTTLMPGRTPAFGGFSDFLLELPVGDGPFANGNRAFTVTGERFDGERFSRTAFIEFSDGVGYEIEDDVVPPPAPGDEAGSDLTPPSQNVSVGTVNASRNSVKMRGNGNLDCSFVITAFVVGMTAEDGTVTAAFEAGGQTRSIALQPANPNVVNPAGETFSRTFSQGTSYNFKGGDTTAFRISASRVSDGQSAGPVLTSQVTFTSGGQPGC